MGAAGPGAVADALVLTVSTRAAAGSRPDESGPALLAALASLGLAADGPEIVADGDPVGARLRAAVRQRYALVVTTGGTGVTPADLTPEQTAPLLDRPLPGIPEAIRAAGITAGKATSMLSRGLAGVALHPEGGGTLLVNLPGSVGAVREAMTVIGPALLHAVDQIAGGDHPWRPGS